MHSFPIFIIAVFSRESFPQIEQDSKTDYIRQIQAELMKKEIGGWVVIGSREEGEREQEPKTGSGLGL